MKTLLRLCVVGVLAGGSVRPCVAQRPTGPATLENLIDADPSPPPGRAGAPKPASEKPASEKPASEKPASEKPASPPPAKAPPAPVPDSAAIKEARGLVKQAYEDDYAAAADNPGPLIDKLLAAAEQTKDAARKYALLLEAEDAAAQGGDCRRAMKVVDTRENAFAIDGIQVRIDMLSRLLTPAARKNPDLLVRLGDSAVETALRAADRDALAQAKVATALADRTSKAIMVIGKTQKKPSLVKDGEARQEQARELMKTYQRRATFLADYQEAVESLKSQPDEPKANRVAGSFLCFERGEWFRGLPLLAKGDQKELAEIAAQESRIFAGGEQQIRDIFELAGRWWAAAETAATPESQEAAMKQHAGRLYESVWEQLEDPLDKAVAKKRMPAPKAAQKAEPAQPSKWFLSDLPEKDVVVGYGSFGKNGDLGFDGHKIDVRGKQFKKGLGTHAVTNGKPAGVSYDVPDGARRLVGAVAINESASKSGSGGAKGPISIEIQGDNGRVRWRSPGLLQRAGDGVEFSVPVDGEKRIRLVAIAQGDGNWGHVVWLDPYFEAK